MFGTNTRTDSERPRSLWRVIVSMLTSFALAVGFVALSATAANATGGPSQDVNCDTITANYHRALTNGDHINVEVSPHGQVNMYVDQNIPGGASYNGQNNLGLRWKILGAEQTPIPLTQAQIESGVITFNYGSALKAKGITNWKVTFVQTNSTDTWPNKECGTPPPPPTPKDASASVAVDMAATCTGNSTVKFSIVNATWDNNSIAEPGTHTRTATATEGHLFGNGTNKETVTYTIDPPALQSSDPHKPCYVPPDKVENNPQISVKEECGKLTLTFSNEVTLRPGQIADAAQFTYTDEQGVTQLVTVEANSGPREVVVSFPEDSGDHVVQYGLRDKPLTSVTIETDCQPNPPVEVPNNPHVTVEKECGKVIATFTNSVTLGENETADPALFEYTEANGEIAVVEVAPNATVVKTVTYPEDSGTQTFKYGLKGEKLTKVKVKTDCQVTPPEEPKYAEFTPPTVVDKCGFENDAVIVGTSDDGSYTSRTIPNEDGTIGFEVVFTPNEGFTVPEPGEGDDYVIIDGKAVWMYSTTNEECPPSSEVPNNPDYTYEVFCGRVAIEFTNAVELKEGETASDAEFTYTNDIGEVIDVVVPVNETRTVMVEFLEDSGEQTVTVGKKGEQTETIVVQTDCEPATEITPEGPTFVDKCGTTEDGYTIPGTPVHGASSTDAEGNVYTTLTYESEQGIYTVFDSTIDGQRDVVVVFEATAPDTVIAPPGENDTYELIEVEGVAVWEFSYTNEDCPVPPKTDKPEEPAGHEVPKTDTPDKKPVVAKVTTPKKLANTGGQDMTGLWIGGGVFVLLGSIVVTTAAIRRRQAAQQ